MFVKASVGQSVPRPAYCWYTEVILGLWPFLFLVGLFTQFRVTAKDHDHRTGTIYEVNVYENYSMNHLPAKDKEFNKRFPMKKSLNNI